MGSEMGSTLTTRGIYEKDSVRAYVPDRISLFHGGQVPQKHGGNFVRLMIGGWRIRVDRFDIVVSLHLTNGRISILPFWDHGHVRFPKNIYYYYQSWWTDEGCIAYFTHWNWSARTRSEKPIDVWVITNADNVVICF
jgi:beta-galactosidase